MHDFFAYTSLHELRCEYGFGPAIERAFHSSSAGEIRREKKLIRISCIQELKKHLHSFLVGNHLLQRVHAIESHPGSAFRYGLDHLGFGIIQAAGVPNCHALWFYTDRLERIEFMEA